MHTGGELTVHANVVFEANTGTYGGAVSLRFDTVALFPVWCFSTGFASARLICEIGAHSLLEGLIIELQSRGSHTFDSLISALRFSCTRAES